MSSQSEKENETYSPEAEDSRHYKKARLYYRQLSALSYSLKDELKRIRKVPRVIKGKDINLKNRSQSAGVMILTPKEKVTQVLFAHYIVMYPGGRSQKHGHMNEAVFYVLDGKGHDIHDGIRYDWEAGDIVVVANSCVHQHFNDDQERPARFLVIKSKPLYLFMNLLMQDVLEEHPKDLLPGQEDFKATFLPE